VRLLLVATLCDAISSIPRRDVERDDSRAGRREPLRKRAKLDRKAQSA
jgi:hypothetical protein